MLKKAGQLKIGDKVDLDFSKLPFPYNDPLKEFEYGIVDSIEPETDDCIVVHFENMTSIAVSPEITLVVSS